MTEWQAHTVVTEEYVDPAPVAALRAVLDSGAPPVGPGHPLPPLWHWAALARWPASSAIGPDGHPARGSFLPPVELPRRMFAGGEVSFYDTVIVGSTVRREAAVVAVTRKTGRTGPLVVVDVEIRLYTDSDTLAVTERQHLIYREAPTAAGTSRPAALFEMAPVGPPLRRMGDWDWELHTDPTVLMRFSAATANPHRIHYDWPYATGVEGYPGLVVHGPLMTLALAEALRREQPGTPPVRLRHRNHAPLFCAQPARIERRNLTDADLALAVRTGHGTDRPVEHTVLTADFDLDGDRAHA
ncbi:FAS1-like dehydratase domain-containing protein [Nocardia sp. NPDC055165]